MKSKGIKNLLIDLGGVLINLDRQRCIENFQKLGLRNVEELLDISNQDGILMQQEKGLITPAEFRNGVREMIGKVVSDKQIDAAWNSFLVDIPTHKLDLLLKLREKYVVYLLSNTNEIHWKWTCKNLFPYRTFKVEDYFEKTYLSFEMKMAKPEPEIFKAILDDAGIEPEETLFIDDSEINCKAAQNLGISTYTGVIFSTVNNLIDMQIIRDISAIKPEPCVATIGFFDGVHAGHRYLIQQVKEIAAAKGLRSALVTFPVHPRKVMNATYRPELLTTPKEKISLLADIGVDYCLMLDFTPDISQLTAREFMNRLLKERYQVKCLVIGYDHRFGHNRSEGFEDYVCYGKEIGIEVIRAQAYTSDIEIGTTRNIPVSSSLIRKLLHEGEVEIAARCLKYEYFLDGTVVGGYQVGRKIGFPTANLSVDDLDKLIPADGVYAVWVTFDGKTYMGMLNIGVRPTIDNGPNRTIEVNILHFHSNIYDKFIRLTFVKRTRPELKFSSIDELIVQLHKDAEETEAILLASKARSNQQEEPRK